MHRKRKENTDGNRGKAKTKTTYVYSDGWFDDMNAYKKSILALKQKSRLEMLKRAATNKKKKKYKQNARKSANSNGKRETDRKFHQLRHPVKLRRGRHVLSLAQQMLKNNDSRQNTERSLTKIIPAKKSETLILNTSKRVVRKQRVISLSIKSKSGKS